MDERSVFDLSPQLSRASEEPLTSFRLLLLAGLLSALLAATLVAG
jgi:hypothetical protein